MTLEVLTALPQPEPQPPAKPRPRASLPPPIAQAMDLKGAIYLVRRHSVMIAAVTGTAMAAALALAFSMTPMYRASTMVMMEPRKTDIVNIDAVMSPLAASSEALRGEMEIIDSRAVIDRVIEQQNLRADPEFNLPPSWWNLFDANRPALSDAEKQERANTRIAAMLKRRLSVSNDGRSYVIKIAVDAASPRKAAALANAFAAAALADQMEAKYDALTRANAWLNGQLGELKDKVETSERAVEEYRRAAKLIQLKDGQTVAARQMEDVNQQLDEARGETSQAEAKLRAAQDMLNSPRGIDSATDVLASPLIQKLREQEAELRRTQADMATKYGSLHPKMIDAQAQYADLQNKIAEEARRVVQGLESQVAVSRAKEQRLAAQLDREENLAGLELKESVALRQLEREAEANREVYENFLNRFKQTSEQSDMQTADSRVVAAATAPMSPAFPNKGLFLLIGAVLGGMLGLLAAYLVEYFDKGYRHAARVEESTGLPVIGVIPDVDETTTRPPENYAVEKPMSAYAEALRTVRTAIHFSNTDQPPKVVMVTSSVPDEGKTTFCLSLARTLAFTGNRILLIDADMRRSRVAAATGIHKVTGGLAEILTGGKRFSQIVEGDPLVAGLDIVLAAGKTPNAQDLLGSHRMRKLIEEVGAKYDLILIDTPPILAVSDAAMVARVADTAVFLVRWAQTPRAEAQAALRQLQNFKCPIAGIVLSQVDMQEQAKYSENYRYRDYAEYYVN